MKLGCFLFSFCFPEEQSPLFSPAASLVSGEGGAVTGMWTVCIKGGAHRDS